MEKQKNFLQYTVNNKKLLPIEEEFLSSICDKLESKFKFKISNILKEHSSPLYDCFALIADNRPFFLKVNVSPDTPNSWDLLSKEKLSFHPSIIDSSSPEEEFKYIFFELPKGIFANDISNYILSSKLNLTDIFTRDYKKIHSCTFSSEDETVAMYNSLLPIESMRIYRKYPIVDVFSVLKILFAETYKKNPSHCNFCHFDLCLENIIYTGSEFKFINFEYSCNGNKYLDMWLTKTLLNCSDDMFDRFIGAYGKTELDLIYSYEELSNYFIFAYFNSKIISEYMTFGVRDPVKLKYWIEQSSIFYSKISHNLYLEKNIDKSIRDFYYLWK